MRGHRDPISGRAIFQKREPAAPIPLRAAPGLLYGCGPTTVADEMRKLTVSTLVTMDCVLQDPGGFGKTENGGWSRPFFDAEALRFSLGHLQAAHIFLCGRRTYELFKDFSACLA
jgi:hypothetical protein